MLKQTDESFFHFVGVYSQALFYHNFTTILDTFPIIFYSKDTKQLFLAYLSQNLTASSSPSLSEIKLVQDYFSKNLFYFKWEGKNGTASGTFTTSASDAKNISGTYLSFPISTETSEVPSAKMAEKLVPLYLSLQPKGTWKCTSDRMITYCENFWQEENGIKKGIVLDNNISKNNAAVISFCEIGKESKNDAKTCIPQPPKPPPNSRNL